MVEFAAHLSRLRMLPLAPVIGPFAVIPQPCKAIDLGPCSNRAFEASCPFRLGPSGWTLGSLERSLPGPILSSTAHFLRSCLVNRRLARLSPSKEHTLPLAFPRRSTTPVLFLHHCWPMHLVSGIPPRAQARGMASFVYFSSSWLRVVRQAVRCCSANGSAR